MNRRKFIKSTIGTDVIIGLVGTTVWFSIDENTDPLSIDLALSIINSFSRQNLTYTGE